MSDATTDVAEVATEEAKPKKTRKSSGPRGPRKSTVCGRPNVVLADYSVPETGIPAESTCDDWELYEHKPLKRDMFADPLDYYTWLRDQYIVQVAKAATEGIESMAGLGSAKVRSDVIAVGGSIKETMAAVKKAAKENKGNPEATAAIQKQLAAMMEQLAKDMDG